MESSANGPASSLLSVSAIVATRTRPELLGKAVSAILDQDYDGAIEVVIVFDQSDVVRTLERDDPQRSVRIISNTRTPGLAGARNGGALASTGDLIAFCDDDDVWLPHKLRRQVAILEAEPATDVVMAGMTIVYDDREIVRIPAAAQITRDDLLRSRVQDAHPSTILVRRDAFFDRIGFVDEELPGSYGEDRDWMLRAARIAPIAIVQESLVRVLWGATSFFADRWQTISDSIDYWLVKHPDAAKDRRGLARLYGRKSFALAATGQRREAARWAIRSLRLSWRDQRAYVALAVCTGVVSAEKAQRVANSRGRGI